MKTRIAILTILMGLLMAGTAMANEPVPATKAASKAVTELLSDEISYPSFASKNNIECCVWVSIMIKEDGSLDVETANCSSCNMKDHVVKSIKETKNEGLSQYAGQNVLLKVKFKLLS
jgi:hypothetical protein